MSSTRGDGTVPSADEALDDGLRALAQCLLPDKSTEEVLGEVADLAAQSLPGCDAASVTLGRNGRPVTPVWSDDVALRLDEAQYDAEEGPCICALESGTVVRIDSYADDPRWRTFAGHALQAGVASSMAVPLAAAGEVIGALNLYSRRPAAFGAVEDRAEVFARQASITLANARALEQARTLAQQLALALENRDVIGQAKGIIMAGEGCTPDEAFDILRRASQRSHRKLHEVAREMVEQRTRRRPVAD